MKLRRLTGPARTDEDRGHLILRADSEIRNHGAFVVEDVIEDLLRSGAWRAYTFPDGTHHEWLDREFDYFVSAQQLEWDKIRRAIVKPDVLTMLADHSAATGGAGENRRALDDVRGQFPHLELVNLVNGQVRTIANSEERRRAFEAGTTLEKATEGDTWRFHVKRKASASVDEKAQAILARLDDDPELRKRIYQLLDTEIVRTRRRAKR